MHRKPPLLAVGCGLALGSVTLAAACTHEGAALELEGIEQSAVREKDLTVDALYGSALVLLADDQAKPLAAFGLGLYRESNDDFADLGEQHATTLILPPATLVRLCHEEQAGVGVDCKEARNVKLKPKLLQLAKSKFHEGFATMEVVPLALLFPELDFKGIPQAIRYGKHPANEGKLDVVGNDQTRSVYMAPGVRVILCAHEPRPGFSNACYDWDEPIGNVNALFPSYAEAQPVITVFDGTNARGSQQHLGAGERFAPVADKVADDEPASIIIPPELTATLCEGSDQSGTCETHARSQLSLSLALAGKVSFVEAKKP